MNCYLTRGNNMQHSYQTTTTTTSPPADYYHESNAINHSSCLYCGKHQDDCACLGLNNQQQQHSTRTTSCNKQSMSCDQQPESSISISSTSASSPIYRADETLLSTQQPHLANNQSTAVGASSSASASRQTADTSFGDTSFDSGELYDQTGGWSSVLANSLSGLGAGAGTGAGDDDDNDCHHQHHHQRDGQPLMASHQDNFDCSTKQYDAMGYKQQSNMLAVEQYDRIQKVPTGLSNTNSSSTGSVASMSGGGDNRYEHTNSGLESMSNYPGTNHSHRQMDDNKTTTTPNDYNNNPARNQLQEQSSFANLMPISIANSCLDNYQHHQPAYHYNTQGNNQYDTHHNDYHNGYQTIEHYPTDNQQAVYATSSPNEQLISTTDHRGVGRYQTTLQGPSHCRSPQESPQSDQRTSGNHCARIQHDNNSGQHRPVMQQHQHQENNTNNTGCQQHFTHEAQYDNLGSRYNNLSSNNNNFQDYNIGYHHQARNSTYHEPHGANLVDNFNHSSATSSLLTIGGHKSPDGSSERQPAIYAAADVDTPYCSSQQHNGVGYNHTTPPTTTTTSAISSQQQHQQVVSTTALDSNPQPTSHTITIDQNSSITTTTTTSNDISNNNNNITINYKRSTNGLAKTRRGRPRKKGLHSKNKVSGKLWEFIRDLLLSERTNPSFIRWERREDGVFKFVQSDKVAKMWGERKQNPKMTYEKLSRAMRYYYKSKVLLPVFGRRLVYKFGPNATGWMPTMGAIGAPMASGLTEQQIY